MLKLTPFSASSDQIVTISQYFEGKGIAFSNFELCNLEVEKRS